MAITLSSTIFPAKFKDDYADSDGYYRILFNSGRSLQARELTQMQTILQKQIERLGSHTFKEGAVVKPGEQILNNAYEFVKLDPTSNALATTGIAGTTFTGQTSGVTARAIEGVQATGSDPATVYFAYTNAPSSQAGTTTVRFTPGEVITNGTAVLTVQIANTTSNPAVGRGTRLSLGQGIYYVQGYFVFVDAQSTIVSKYTDVPTETIGFTINEKIIDVDDDEGLYDNQGALPNISAPGADRYQIKLNLTTETAADPTLNFMPILNIQDGVVYRSTDENNTYNIVGDVVATRIKENSGNYLVKRFKVAIDPDSDKDNLLVNISDGIAVVDGYRAAKYAPSTIRIAKPSSTAEVENEVTPANFGNYVLVNALMGTANNKGLPNISTFEKFNLRDAGNHGGSTIGTCRIRSVMKDTGAFVRYYLFDIQMLPGQNFRSTVSIGTSVNDFINLHRPLGKAELFDVFDNNALFPLPQHRPQSLDDISVTVQRRFQVTTSGAGAASLSLSATGETFANVNDWLFAKADSDIFTGTVGNNGAGAAAANLTGLPASSTIEILGYVAKSKATIRNKTLTETTVTASVINGELLLGKPDIFEVTRIREKDSNGRDFTLKFDLDNGQRDNHYRNGRLNLRAGLATPTNPVFVRFKHFTHGVNGDFFAVNSYIGQCDYHKIPSHTLNTGANVSLRNVLDFRSVMDIDSDFVTSGTGARVNELPQVNDTIQADVNYYLHRPAILTINTEGNLQLINGEEAFQPKLPDVPIGSLPLYNMYFGGNTLNDSDTIIQKIDHRRYTMKDIATLERRIDDIEEHTALNLLEIDTKNFKVLDSAGLDRTKSGFFVDNFSTQLFSNIASADYRASIDPLVNQLHPAFHEDNIRLIYDSANSSGVIRKGDNIYMNHSSVPYISQTKASRSVKINPFEAVIYHGDIDLSPSSDEWRETQIRTKKIMNGGTKLDTDQAYLWNNWQWNWGGTKIEDLAVGSKTNTKSTFTASKITHDTNKVVSEETLLEVTDERVVNVSLLPFMRSRKIFFRAQGLRPSSTVFPFFDGIRVDDWVREETFTRMSAQSQEYGNIHDKAGTHPEGSSALTTDVNGAVEGSFFLPNTAAIRFRTGTLEFKILDISSNNEQNAGSIARGLYASTGYLDTKDQDILSTRVLHIEHSQTVDNRPQYSHSGGGGGGGGDNEVSSDGSYQDFPGSSSWSSSTPMSERGWGDPDMQGRTAAETAHGAGNHGGGNSGKIICTALHQMGLLPFDIFAADQAYGAKLAITNPDIVKGYHTWAQVVVDWMNGDENAPNVMPWIRDDKVRIERTRNWAIRWAQAIATPWAIQMAYEMGVREKGSKLGKFLMHVGYPISSMVAKSGKVNPYLMLAIFGLLKIIVSIGGDNKYIDNTVTEQK